MTDERTIAGLLFALGVPSILAGVYLTASGGGVHHLLLTGLGANAMGTTLLAEAETTTTGADDAGTDDAT